MGYTMADACEASARGRCVVYVYLLIQPRSDDLKTQISTHPYYTRYLHHDSYFTHHMSDITANL